MITGDPVQGTSGGEGVKGYGKGGKKHKNGRVWEDGSGAWLAGQD